MENYAQRVIDLLGVQATADTGLWGPTEESVGAELPTDYKELVSHTGAVVVDGWLCLFGPSLVDINSSLARLVEERESAWNVFRDAGVQLQESYFSGGGRLLAFASIDANYFFWHAVRDVEPDNWKVVFVDADLQGWYDLEMSATECIYRVLTGGVRLEPFDDLFGGPGHRVEKFPSFAA